MIRVILLLSFSLPACSPIQPRIGYPWVESSQLALRHELLEIDLYPARARVSAKMTFEARRALGGVEMGFPEDERDAALEPFSASWEGRCLAVELDGGGLLSGHLPLSRVRRWHLFATPPIAARVRRSLLVRYDQRVEGSRFRYLIRTGAYWRGPIERLEVRVRLHGVRPRAAELDGHPPTRATARELRWSLSRIEPSEDLLISWRSG